MMEALITMQIMQLAMCIDTDGCISINKYEKVSKHKFNQNKPIWAKDLSEELYQRCKLLNLRGQSEKESVVPKLIRKTITLEEYYD